MREHAVFASLCTDLIGEGCAVRFCATGTSMHPTIRDGETVLVQPVDVAAVRRGDILLYRSQRGLTAHRVIRVVSGPGVTRSFVLRADNAARCEELVGAGDVLGGVVSIDRGSRRVDPASRWIWLVARMRRKLAALRRQFLALAALSGVSSSQTVRLAAEDG